jgi:hypothetical protein
MRQVKVSIVFMLITGLLSACEVPKEESPEASAETVTAESTADTEANDGGGDEPSAATMDAPPTLPSGPPTTEAEARLMAVGTWEGQDTNGIFTRYVISEAGGTFSVVECSMYNNMNCGEIGGSHDIVQGRFLDTGEPYYALQLSWSSKLVLRSPTEARVSDEDGSVTFTKK